jgi:hypothetical protein
MLRLAVVLIALGSLYGLTALALWSTRRLRHPVVVAAALAAVLGTGIVLLLD